MTSHVEQVRGLVAPLAAEVGVDLVDVSIRGAGPKQKVRVVIDRKGGIEVDHLTQLSRQLSDLMDVTDPIPGRFTLEVTSPGVDWPLEGRDAFDRVEGREVLIHRADESGRNPGQIRGKVIAADEDGVLLETEQGTVHVPYDEIVGANQTLPW